MLFFSPRIPTKTLAQLCRRIGTSLEAGLEIRDIWRREAERGAPPHRRLVRLVNDSVQRGDQVSLGLRRTGKYFPELFREMVHVGEETGNLDRVLLQLADHYDHQLSLRRAFLAAISLPLLYLAMAVGVIGVLILALGWIGPRSSETVDVLGWGLVGPRGLAIYATFIAAAGLIVALVARAAVRGELWIAPLQLVALHLPVLGKALRTLALSRMAWTLSLTTNTELDLRRALELGQRSTHNSFYTRHIPAVDQLLLEGNEIHFALRRTGAYPDEFTDVVETGETSGRLSESMTTLSRQFQERAQAALAVLTMLAAFLVWGLIALMIIALIVRIFVTAYLGPINELMNDLKM
jgi:type II secretory pathway component PulF